MSSRRIYITLNDTKEKDRTILEYLSQAYSESDAIKESLYRLATNNTQSMQTVTNNTEKVQNKPKRNSKVKKGADSSVKIQNDTKDNKNVRKGANNGNKVEKVPKVNDKVQDDDVGLDLSKIVEDSNQEVQVEPKGNTDKIKQNELEQLKEFMN